MAHLLPAGEINQSQKESRLGLHPFLDLFHSQRGTGKFWCGFKPILEYVMLCDRLGPANCLRKHFCRRQLLCFLFFSSFFFFFLFFFLQTACCSGSIATISDKSLLGVWAAGWKAPNSQLPGEREDTQRRHASYSPWL